MCYGDASASATEVSVMGSNHKKINFPHYIKRLNHRCQPSRNRAGNPAFLLISRIPAFFRERPTFLVLFRNNKKNSENRNKFSCTVEPLTNDHPHQRPSLSYDHISCDGQWFLFVYESLTSDHPSYTTTPMWFWGWSYKRGSTVQRHFVRKSSAKTSKIASTSY